MAKSVKKMGAKAERLIEQGDEADKKIRSCQASVASANNQVAAARRRLAAASEKDEAGNPRGDIVRARLELNRAEAELETSQRALSDAHGDAARIEQAKGVHVREIESHNRAERSNLEKLRSLRWKAFGNHAASLAQGMADRLNKAEDARIELLRSMGMDAVSDYVAIDSDGADSSGWRQER